MFFETQAKAENFLKYNREKILEENGVAPTRSYYCMMCAGYHLTSKASEEFGAIMNHKDEVRLKQWQELKGRMKKQREIYKEKKRILKEQIKQEQEVILAECAEKEKDLSAQIRKVRKHLLLGQESEGAAQLEICQEKLEILRFYSCFNPSSLEKKINEQYAILELIQQYFAQIDLEHLEFSEEETTGNPDPLKVILNNYLITKKIDEIAKTTHELLLCKETEGVLENIEKGFALLKLIPQVEGKGITGDYIQKLNLLNSQRKKILRQREKKLKEEERHAKRLVEMFIAKPQDFSTTIVEMIERLEKFEVALKEKDYQRCEELMEIAEACLLALPPNDCKTKLVMIQMEKNRERLRQFYAEE